MRTFGFHQFITHVSGITKNGYVTLSLDPNLMESVSTWDVHQALPMLSFELADELATDYGLVIECTDLEGHELVASILEVFDSIPGYGLCVTLHAQGHVILHFEQGESQEIIYTHVYDTVQALAI